MYPWDVQVRLRRFLASEAQVVASIPNIRNLTLVSRLLLGGRFDYDECRLLDVSHLRFFTLDGIRRMLRETGYVLERDMAIILPALEHVYRSYQGRGPVMVRIGRMTVADVTQQEFTELCAAQFLTRARLAWPGGFAPGVLVRGFVRGAYNLYYVKSATDEMRDGPMKVSPNNEV